FTGILNLRVLRQLFAGLQLYISLLPIAAIPRKAPAPPQLARRRRRPNVLDLHLEQRLDRLPDLRLVRIRSDFETQSPLVVFLRHTRCGDQRLLYHVVQPDHASASESFSAAA